MTQDFSLRILPVHWDDKDQLGKTANALRSVRLDALQLALDAYASTYEKEVEFPKDLWLQRLQNPQARHLVAVLKQKDDGKAGNQVYGTEPLGKWIGLIVVMEKPSPVRANASTSPWTYNASQKTTTKAMEEMESTQVPTDVVYQLNGLFVHPSVRGGGLGRALIQESYTYVRTSIIRQGLLSARVDVLVDSWNTSARNLYLSCGFEFVSQDSYDVGGSPRIALSLSVTIHATQ
ncbi:hypothetical protein MMC26_000967 [Xylographa opegraphella]|nr:hypothetical protein [Xylographa opegraphella]